MKKIMKISTGLAAVTVIALSTSCGKAVSCVKLITEVSAAASTYAADTSTGGPSCLAYKAALNSFLNNSKCTGDDPTTKATYEAAIAELNTECP
jgi:hypothetical protein